MWNPLKNYWTRQIDPNINPTNSSIEETNNNGVKTDDWEYINSDETVEREQELEIQNEYKKTCEESLQSDDVLYFKYTNWPFKAFHEELNETIYKKTYASTTPGNLKYDSSKDLSIFCITWNTESMDICGMRTDNEQDFTYYGTYKACYKPDFLMPLIRKFYNGPFNTALMQDDNLPNDKRVDILCFALQSKKSNAAGSRRN